MKANQCVDLQEQMKKDLQAHASEPKYSTTVVSGQGFKQLNLNSDYCPCPKIQLSQLDNFLNAHVPTLELNPQVHQKVRQFCSTLKHTKIDKLKKFEFIYSDQGGKGTWVGLFFKKTSATECYFISHVISCAFVLAPDVLVIREETTDRFGPFRTTDSSIYLVERPRGFTRKDLEAIMNVCSFMTGQKAITMG